MTRATVIATLWLLLTGGIGDAVSGGESPLRLLALYAGMSTLAALGLWLHFRDDGEDPPAGGPRRPRRDPYRYD